MTRTEAEAEASVNGDEAVGCAEDLALLVVFVSTLFDIDDI